MRFFKIIRLNNLLLIALVQVLVTFYLLPLFIIESRLTTIEFILIVLATLFITVGGYIVNDLNDIEIDKINKPDRVWIPLLISKKNVFVVYILTTVIGVLLAGFFSYLIDDYYTILFFLAPIILLYLYAKKLKKIFLIGNVLVSLLSAYSIFLISYFEKVLVYNPLVYKLQLSEVIFGLLFFAFSMSLLREIVKDNEDSIGDRAMGVQSIYIKYGEKTTHFFIEAVGVIIISVLLLIIAYLYKEQVLFVAYLFLAVVLSMVLFIKQLKKVKTLYDYNRLSTLLKLIMFIGILAVFMIQA